MIGTLPVWFSTGQDIVRIPDALDQALDTVDHEHSTSYNVFFDLRTIFIGCYTCTSVRRSDAGPHATQAVTRFSASAQRTSRLLPSSPRCAVLTTRHSDGILPSLSFPRPPRLVGDTRAGGAPAPHLLREGWCLLTMPALETLRQHLWPAVRPRLLTRRIPGTSPDPLSPSAK